MPKSAPLTRRVHPRPGQPQHQGPAREEHLNCEVEVKVRSLSIVLNNPDYEVARDELYKNRSSRKIDSQRPFSSKYDFPKTFSLLLRGFHI